MPTYSSIVELQKGINSACERAVKNACNRLLGTLQEIINEEFYDQWEPEVYERTFAFYRSAVTEMLSKNIGAVFMDSDSMDCYKDIDGINQLEWANEGIHGGWYNQKTLQHKFWEVFIEYCNKNAIRILKEELRAQKLNVK